MIYVLCNTLLFRKKGRMTERSFVMLNCEKCMRTKTEKTVKNIQKMGFEVDCSL